MHYFSIHTQSGSHLGFLIMLPDDESETPPESGRFVVKLQNGAAFPALENLQNPDAPLVWRINKERIELFDGESNVATLRNEYLTIGGQTLLLTDLTGAM
ncbi:HLGFF motif protein [Neisseria chenwenguii]|uniref:Uncharacterized protein n=1 Tax=Neisseria chenwenguii TaxID=1853278 RepID=A0A220S4T1_9NEIS|nr:hypothetical protein [Neisseria chenwenguii]ASK28529.1 hypothetical protein BG910_08925 [Neisseria chenwenguii]ROV56664.1 hypothetical protein EGS38_04520 [Neisseria chenwenguii]